MLISFCIAFDTDLFAKTTSEIENIHFCLNCIWTWFNRYMAKYVYRLSPIKVFCNSSRIFCEITCYFNNFVIKLNYVQQLWEILFCKISFSSNLFSFWSWGTILFMKLKLWNPHLICINSSYMWIFFFSTS